VYAGGGASSGRPTGGRGHSGGVVLIRGSHDDVHPNPHGFGARGHHVEKAFVGFDAERQAGAGALQRAGNSVVRTADLNSNPYPATCDTGQIKILWTSVAPIDPTSKGY
jgi:hypothetical protein